MRLNQRLSSGLCRPPQDGRGAAKSPVFDWDAEVADDASETVAQIRRLEPHVTNAAMVARQVVKRIKAVKMVDREISHRLR